MNIDGKVVFVTGASSSIGAATARELARRGATAVLAARRANGSAGFSPRSTPDEDGPRCGTRRNGRRRSWRRWPSGTYRLAVDLARQMGRRQWEQFRRWPRWLKNIGCASLDQMGESAGLILGHFSDILAVTRRPFGQESERQTIC